MRKSQRLKNLVEENEILPRRRGRVGGNPDLVKFQFQKKGEVPRTRTLAWRVTEHEFQKAKEIPDLSDRFRAWLATQLEEFQKSGNAA